MGKSVFTDHYGKFRTLLIQVRRATGLTQIDLAKKLNRPQSYVSKYERGERRLDVIEFIEIAKAIGVSPVDLLKKLGKVSQSKSDQ